MNTYIAVTDSMTTAIKAQKILAKSSIPSNVIKLKASESGNGCSYGLNFDYIHYAVVNHILEQAHIKINKYTTGGGSM